MLFTPMITSCFTLFVCSEYTCEAGTRFPERFSGFSISTLLKGTVNEEVCEVCEFITNCTAVAEEICPRVTENRMIHDPSLACFSDIAPFFWAPAALSGVLWMFLLPLFYFMVIFSTTRKIKGMNIDCLCNENVPFWVRNPKKSVKLQKKLKSGKMKKDPKRPETDYMFECPNPADENCRVVAPELGVLEKELEKKKRKWGQKRKREEELWKIRTAITNNPVKSLFNAFLFRFRFFKIFNTFAKILLVFCSVALILYPRVSIPFSLAVHLLTTVGFFVTFPFISSWEDILHITVNSATLLTCVYLIFPTFGITVPTFIPIVIMIVNCFIPIIAIVEALVATINRKQYRKCVLKTLNSLEGYQMEGLINQRRKVDYAKIKKNIKDVDESISSTVLKYVLIFFMVIGLFAAVSAIFSSVGLLYHEIVPSVIQTDSSYSNIHNQFLDSGKDLNLLQFAGYQNWTEFSQRCCCSITSKYEENIIRSSTWLGVESWTCSNGKTKERVRVEKLDGVIINGSNIRGMCEPWFTSNEFYLEEVIEDSEYLMLQLLGGDLYAYYPALNMTAGIELHIRRYLW